MPWSSLFGRTPSSSGIRTPRRGGRRRRLQALCLYQTGALEPLDVNRRVLVTGGAGSGKTRLAMAWTRRALARSERVWLTCYNDPLADAVAERLTPNELLTVGSFYDVALHLDGMPELEVPDGAPARGGTRVAVGHCTATGATSPLGSTRSSSTKRRTSARPGWRSSSSCSTGADRGG